MELIFMSPTDAAVEMIRVMVAKGRRVAPRDASTRERTDVTLKILEPNRLPVIMPGRMLSRRIAALEALQLVGQATRPDLAEGTGLAAFRDGGIFWGGYGQRIHGQLDHVVDLLLDDSASRQAVLSIHHASLDLGRSKRDIPCTLTVQFLLRHDKLRMRVSMRSNDVWLGLPYDLFQFASLHGAVAAALSVEQGTYVHTVGSMHIYERDIERALGFRDSYTPTSMPPAEQLWSPMSIGAISRTARAILDRQPTTTTTSHEQWLKEAMSI